MLYNRKWIAKILTVLLALSMIGSVMASCADTKDHDDKDDQGTAQGSQNESEETNKAYDTVEKKKYGRDFVILARGDDDSMENEFKADAMNGEVLNDAIYERNITVKQDYDIDFKYEGKRYDEINEMVRKQVRGNLNDYNLYIGHKYSYGLCESNQLYDMAKIPTIDLSREWWDHAYIENTAVGGKVYMAISDVNVTSMTTTSCLTFNKKMLDELNHSVDELNAMVNNGKWTIDRMIELCADVTRDLNSDDKLTKEDQYGMTSWMMDVPYSLFYGCGCRYITMDEDKQPGLDFNQEKVVDVYDKIHRLIIDQESYFVTDEKEYGTNYEVFNAGRSLFCDITLWKISEFLTEATDPYGIIPMPKYDENQKEYQAFVNGSTTSLMIAKSEKDPQFVGAILEAMGAYNYDKVTPLLFEVVTKLHAAQDPQSSAMVDYIVRNRIYDFAYCADFELGELVRTSLRDGSKSIASSLKSNQTKSRNMLKQIIRKFQRCD